MSVPFLLTGCFMALLGASDDVLFESLLIFDPASEEHGHVHASCVVECPGGDLRAVWYENGPELPAPYFSENRDKSDDVRIGGSRMAKGNIAWDACHVVSDTFGVSDNNPCMVVDRDGRLWLFHAVLLGVPEVSWTSALIRYKISAQYGEEGAPAWDMENLLIPHLFSLETTPNKAAPLPGNETDTPAKIRKREKSVDPYKTRLGWMPRSHPIIRSDGALLLPLANENYGIAAMAITKDGGATWAMGEAVPGRGLEQPTVVEFPDGMMKAFFRNGHLAHRIMSSDSKDGGVTWSPVEKTALPHPNAGIEAIVTASGRLLMIYNDSEEERDRLAVSLSDDRGLTWTHTRHLENTPGERFDYPSIIQGNDCSFHATYSYNTNTIKYAHFNEAWIMAGDDAS